MAAGSPEDGAGAAQGGKGFGYGKPLLVAYEVDGVAREAVVSTMRSEAYGHQFPWDRGAALWFQFDAAKRMERHAKPLALGYVDADGGLCALDDPQEIFLVLEKVPGHDYYLDLERIVRQGLTPADQDMAQSLARWLAHVHAEKGNDPILYLRRVRELLGGNECIPGVIDLAYPLDYPLFPAERFQAVEKRLVEWRWRLKDYTHRLAAVHGDFHPWNILVDGGAFRVLDRSRGEWGEPADDVAAMAINYLLFGLLAGNGSVAPDFLSLYQTFVSTYLDATDDTELAEVMAPFLVFRALVVASPQWYPDHPPGVRQALLAMVENALADDRFDFAAPGRYLEA
jgi:hypothetical protein